VNANPPDKSTELQTLEELPRIVIESEEDLVSLGVLDPERGLVDPKEAWHLVAISCLNRFLFLYIAREDTLLTYDKCEGIWKEEGDDVVYVEVEKILQKYATSRAKGEVLRHVKDKAPRVTRGQLNRNPRLIPAANGVIDISTDSPTFRPHSPSNFFTFKLPVCYDPEADPAPFERFLEEILPNEIDRDIIKEFIGYSLYRDQPFHVALMLLGGGANGKSTLLNIITAFLGKENVSHQTLQDLDRNRFAAARLWGKLANIYPDIPPDGLKQTGRFKATTGNDFVDVERKYKEAFQAELYAKQIYSANQLPRTLDLTDAMVRRWRVIDFPYEFVEGEPNGPNQKKADPHILERLTRPEVLNGLLNLALKYLHKVLEQGGITRNQTLDDLRARWEREADPVAAFVEECVEFDAEATATREEVYRAYCAYCGRIKRPALGKQTFDQQFQKRALVESTRLTDQSGRRVQAWRGVRIVEPAAQTTLSGDSRRLRQTCQTCQTSLSLLSITGSNSTKEKGRKGLTSLTGLTEIAGDLVGWVYDFGLAEEKQAVEYLRIEHDLNGEEARELISALKRRGDLYEPRPGFLAASLRGGQRGKEGS